MERSLIVYLNNLANRLTTELTGNLNYVVKDNIQYFNNDLEDMGSKYVPAVIELVSDFTRSDKYLVMETYKIKFHVLDFNKELFIQDIESYKALQQPEVIGDMYIQKVFQSLSYENNAIINGIEYYVYSMEFAFTYAKTITGVGTVIKIGGIAIPFTNCIATHDISYISTQGLKDNLRMTNDLITLTVPLILSNAKVLELHNLSNSDFYNIVLDVEINGVLKNLALKKTTLTISKETALTSMVLLLETAYDRVPMTIDGHLVAIGSYRYDAKKVNKPVRPSIDGIKSDLVKSYATGKVRTFSMTIINDGSVLYQKISDDAYGNEKNIKYTLEVKGNTYLVSLGDSNEQYTETGNTAIECMFVEYVD